jgi:hypothetical protein
VVCCFAAGALLRVLSGSAASCHALLVALPKHTHPSVPMHTCTYWFCGWCSADCMLVMWRATDRASRVPTVVEASRGVNTMWLRGEITCVHGSCW